MNCAEAQRYLAPLADDESPGELRAQLREHLNACPTCTAELARWKALRSAAHRGLGGAAAAVPAELELRIRARLRARSPARRRLVLRVGALVGAAAIVLLAVALWPARATPIDADDFFSIHERCARAAGPHDTIAADARPLADVNAAARKRAGFDARLPDLSSQGYKLIGVCTCCPDRSGDAHAVHAAYADLSAPARTVSLFSFAQRVELQNARTPCKKSKLGRREYQQAVRGPVYLLKWDEGRRSYALGGAVPMTELAKLADVVRAARGRGIARPVAQFAP